MATQTHMTAEQILHIPLSSIKPSKTNPRQTMDEKALADLAADIKHRGVQEPVLLRPLPGSPDKFQIVFGERRYWASEKASKKTVPAIVREMSDEEAYELQVIENLQRENLHPLDEAEAFHRLYVIATKQKNGHDESLKLVAGQVAKKPEFLAQRMKLRDLTETAKAAFRKNKILLGHAFEIARLQESEQQRALKWMLERGKDVQTATGWKRVHIMPGVPELKLWIRENVFLDLTKAPFDTADPTLNSKMGACTDCQFRTGNQPALFGDVKQDSTCTVPSCWLLKRDASLVNLAGSIAKELGVEFVLKVGVGHAGGNDSKVPVDVYIDYSSTARVVKKGSECKHTKPGVITWIRYAHDSGSLKVGDSVQVCTKADVCSVHNKVDSRSERKRKSFEDMADTRIANLRQEFPQRVRAALIRAVIENAQKERRVLSPTDNIKFALVAQQMHHDLYFDRHRDLCKLMGVEPARDKANQSKDWRGASSKMFDAHPVAMMVAMTLMHRYHVGSYSGCDPDPLKSLLGVYKVDAKAVANKIRTDNDSKIASIQTALKERKARLLKGR
jgi:ParB family chromosome partitioning protein